MYRNTCIHLVIFIAFQMQDIIFNNITCLQKYSFFDNEISRMKNKGEFCIWKRMKYGRQKQQESRFSALLRNGFITGYDIPWLFPWFSIFVAIGENAYHSNAINRFRSEFELLLNKMIVFIEWLLFLLFWLFVFYLLTNLGMLQLRSMIIIRLK